MKKKNLKLSDLRVQSFVTSLEQKETGTIKGGATEPDVCLTRPPCGIIIITRGQHQTGFICIVDTNRTCVAPMLPPIC